MKPTTLKRFELTRRWKDKLRDQSRQEYKVYLRNIVKSLKISRNLVHSKFINFLLIKRRTDHAFGNMLITTRQPKKLISIVPFFIIH